MDDSAAARRAKGATPLVQPAYFNAYRSVKMARDAQGVLVVEFHTQGGPTWPLRR
ncbi:MAG TPA: hypothetical protein VME43_19580 [Bryobacteraceae bacterium]|nr:hypothetical protein [Bryobacteraceae bacterium]